MKMYCCGPTVYDYLHIGNFRGAVFFNFVRNWIEMSGPPVDFIYNFTDIDDKILNRSKKEGVLPKDLAEKYIQEFQKDYQALKLTAHSANPRATQTLPEIIHFIEKLLERGAAYQVEGDVFFSVSSFKGYGALSGKNPMSSWRALGWSLTQEKKILWILLCGKARKRAKLGALKAPGAKAARAGILNAAP